MKTLSACSYFIYRKFAMDDKICAVVGKLQQRLGIQRSLYNFYHSSLSSKVCKFFDFFVVADKSTTIFTGFNETEVLHLWILNQMFCEYTGQLNLSE